MDGERMTVPEVDIQVVPHAQDEWLNAHKFFKQFRNEALVGGHSVRSYNLGQHFPKLCTGVGVKWAPVKRTPDGVEEGHIVPGRTQGELHAAAPTAGYDEVITDGDPLPLLDAAHESDRRWGVKWERAGEGEPIHLDVLSGKKTSGGSVMMMLAICGVVGCVYFLR